MDRLERDPVLCPKCPIALLVGLEVHVSVFSHPF